MSFFRLKVKKRDSQDDLLPGLLEPQLARL